MTAHHHRARRTLILLVKAALAVAILSYLIVQVQRNEGFARLVDQPKQWGILAAALGCTFCAVTLTFFRWHVLITALDLPFHFVDTLRLASLGFALNFVSLGSVGGDLFKAVFLAREFPGRRTDAVATVIADRLMGLLTYLAVASVAILAADWSHVSAAAEVLCDTILLVTAVGYTVVGLILLVPALSGPRIQDWIASLPVVGAICARLLGAVSAYRSQKLKLLMAGSISVALAALFITSFYLVARGLPLDAPTFADHAIIVPIANLAGAIPATPSGLGTLEAVAEALYQQVPSHFGVVPGDGTMVALAHRLTMITVAVIGMIYYVGRRGSVSQAIHDVEEAVEEAELMES
jgi:uncharacterized protein (TIRG00374 family)